ncbi:ornithine--oxo-acid transaminase [bacterium]|nr:ornithine--oxo-acid transaminase [bacterium]
MNLPLSALGKHHIALNDDFGAHNYHPLPVVLARGQAEWVWDVDGKRYLDMLSAYSAINQGHVHPRMLETLLEQSARITLTSRAFYNDQLGPWLKELTDLCQMDRALPMNSGAEAVETAIKLARKWGYLVKKVPHDQAEIIVCDANFHGRTTMIVGFSSDSQYRADFGPFTGGFKIVPYGDADALRSAITPNTVGFLVEPIQGEAGVIVPPDGYLAECDEICKKNKVLFLVDEIQTGLCRTGKTFCFQYENCKPELLILGKALGGGFYPISAVVGSDEVLGLLKPGDHGSTFGGNPLACALSRTAMRILKDENLANRAFELGELFRSQLLLNLPKEVVKEVRGKGLLNAIELQTSAGPARNFSEQLALRGLLAKETRATTIRFAPPLVISRESLSWALQQIEEVFSVPRR